MCCWELLKRYAIMPEFSDSTMANTNTMQKNRQKFDSITHFIQTGGFEYRVFEMGRKILPLSKDLFQQIENQQVLYPYPFQQKAWLAVLIWQPGKESEAVIWFLQFPVDELGYLKQEARDAFLIDLLEQAGKNIQAKQKGNKILDGLGESSFAFKPREDRLAMIHALASKALGQRVSHYYQATREYLLGTLGYDQWPFLGVQGIADVVVRLDEEDNETLLIKAVSRMPGVPLENFANALEYAALNDLLAEAVLKQLAKVLIGEREKNPRDDVRLVAALLSALSASNSQKLRQKILHEVLQSSFSRRIEVLAVISGRFWNDLRSKGLLSEFLGKLVAQEQFAFNAIVTDLMMIPGMKEPVMDVLRSPSRGEDLAEKFGAFMQQIRDPLT